MKNILLVSEDYIKENSNLNDNTWGKYLLPAIREAQELNLTEFIGEGLYNRIIDLVDTGDIAMPVNVAYKALLDDYIRKYLMYQALANIVPYINVAMANIGTVIHNDEHVQILSAGNIELVQNDYQFKADAYCAKMQRHILDNIEAFPEVDNCACQKIKAHLDSSASCSFWLGGPRAYNY